MAICVGCNQPHNSYRAYCSVCMQTQAITKAIEESQRQTSRQYSSSEDRYEGYGGVSGGASDPYWDTRPAIVKWFHYAHWGTPCFVIWFMVMASWIFGLHEFSWWDLLWGFIFFAKMGNEI